MRKILLSVYLLFSINLFGFAQLPELEKLRASLKTVSDSLKYVDDLNRLAMLMYESNVDSTFYLAKQAREISLRHNYEQGKADALNNLGVFFSLKGCNQLALYYYSLAHTNYISIGDSVNIVQTMMNLGITYHAIGNFKQSVKWFDGAAKMGNKLSNDSIMGRVILNYLFAFPQKFDKKATKDGINKVEKISRKYNDERQLLTLQSVTASDLLSQGKEKEGLQLYLHVIDIGIQKKLFHTAMDQLAYIGDILAKKDSALAVAKYQEALKVSNESGFLSYSKVIAKTMFEFYRSRGDNIKAVSYGRKLIELEEREIKLNNSSSIDYMDYALKEQKVATLTIQSKYQVVLIIVITIVCVLALAILIVVKKNLRKNKRLNEQITSQNDKLTGTLLALEQSQTENTQMLKIVAHDLRSPIAGIHLLSNLMIDEDNRSSTDLEMLKLIKDSSKNSLILVNDLLHIQFKIEKLNKELIDLAELLEYCVALLRNSALAKKQIINLHVKHVMLLASGEKLWRVMSNLIGNAIKFSPKHTTIEISMVQTTEVVRLGISDEGIGIPPDIENRIFDIFTEVKRTGTDGEETFGLGLAISKQIVDAHGGKIWFERKTDKGTIFFVELPFLSS
ncbi:tetratricopeptide repeat-containing sensor histidine kinase [Pedobacter psychrodurus]|uniref:ATP-binding protein n=1 Tax=Pedobacter psychrodurus TaxID=2530456 RepID=UPI00292E50CE|nr:tetratricopeptide repeat-containing sensor histidine kinase [Pedobacter psychrodurus]